MSLSRLAIRLAAVKALAGRTLAGDAVSDSEVSAIDVAAADRRRPFIAVYCDDGEGHGIGRDIQPGSFSLAIEIGVTSRMKYTLENGAEDHVEALVPSDALMEMTLDLIARQIALALADPGNEWADLWRRLVSKIGRVRTRRGASADKLLRFAGRQLEIDVHPLADPPCGKAPVGVWRDLLALIEADADPAFRALAAPIRATIAGEAPAPDWSIDQAQLALSGGEAASMLLTQPEGVGPDDVGIDAIVNSGAEPSG